MFKCRLPLLCTLVLLAAGILIPWPAPASTAVEQRVEQVQKKYQQIHSLQFDFSQNTQTNGRLKAGNGHAVFYRMPATKPGTGPLGLMRWDYVGPVAQTIVNDGTDLSIYTPQDKQLIISPAQAMESDITYAIFTGTRSLLSEFAAAPADPGFHLNPAFVGSNAILLTPRQSHPQLKRLQIWLTGDHTIERLLMEDHFGALTELSFTNIRIDALRSGDTQQVERLRDLDIPPDTEIIRQ